MVPETGKNLTFRNRGRIIHPRSSQILDQTMFSSAILFGFGDIPKRRGHYFRTKVPLGGRNRRTKLGEDFTELFLKFLNA